MGVETGRDTVGLDSKYKCALNYTLIQIDRRKKVKSAKEINDKLFAPIHNVHYILQWLKCELDCLKKDESKLKTMSTQDRIAR